MRVEGGGPIPFHFEEELWADWVYRLDEMLADQEAADNEVRASADPMLRIRAVLVV
jgi:hypothetical protein